MKTTDEHVARAILGESSLSWSDAVRLIIELLESADGKQGETHGELMRRLRRAIQLGVVQERRERATVPFARAVQASIEARLHRRPNTVADLRYLARRLLRDNPQLADRPLRLITTEECRRCLERAFSTPSQFKKGRAFLHSVFSFGNRREWCTENPVTRVEVPAIREREITPLSLNDIRRLTRSVVTAEFEACAPAVGMMLWAGVRPAEVVRLDWRDIVWEDGVIALRARHSKTGGARHVSIPPVLRRWLAPHFRKEGPLCPMDWKRQWPRLRRRAGLGNWSPDTLRHTFASYHAKLHRDLQTLSLEMGHAGLNLLRTRYLNLGQLTRADARHFWAGDWLRHFENRGPLKSDRAVPPGAVAPSSLS